MRALGLLPLLSAAACGGGTLTVPMDPYNNSGQSGFARLTDTGGGLQVELELQLGNVMLPHTTHFHPGRCGELGRFELTFPDTQKQIALPQLESTGTVLRADTVLKGLTLRDFTQDPKRQWAINVHDPRDFSLYVACGDL